MYGWVINTACDTYRITGRLREAEGGGRRGAAVAGSGAWAHYICRCKPRTKTVLRPYNQSTWGVGGGAAPVVPQPLSSLDGGS